MKTKIIAYLWAVALVFCATQKVVAQGFVEPLEHTRYYTPDEGYTNITLFEIKVYGNESNYVSESAYLNGVHIQLDPSTFSKKLSNVRVCLYFERVDTSYYYDHDIIFDNTGFASIFTNFNGLLKKKFVQVFRITGTVNTDGLKYGDKLSVGVKLDISLNGGPPNWYIPENQYLIYHGGDPNSISNPSIQKIIYPNPFNDKINLLNFNEKEIVTLTNSIGQIIFTGSSGEPILTSNLVAGVYFLRTDNLVYKLIKK